MFKNSAGSFSTTTTTTLRSLVCVVAVLTLSVSVAACTDDSSGGSGSSSTVDSASGSSGAEVTVPVSDDDVFALSFASDQVSYRGGSVSASDLVKVKAKPVVETPVPLAFAASVDKVLKDRSRNQLRTVFAAAKDDRGDTPRADPIRIERNRLKNVAIMVFVDNPTDSALSGLQIDGQFLKGTTDVGHATFKVSASEVASVPANSAVFVVLEMNKSRLTDPEMALTDLALRLDLKFNSD